MKMKKNNKARLFEITARLDETFKPKFDENVEQPEVLQERLVTFATDIHREISKIPDIKRIDFWSTANGMVGLYRYEKDGNAYEIDIRPVQIGQYKDLWGDKIKKKEEREIKNENVDPYFDKKLYQTKTDAIKAVIDKLFINEEYDIIDTLYRLMVERIKSSKMISKSYLPESQEKNDIIDTINKLCQQLNESKSIK